MEARLLKEGNWIIDYEVDADVTIYYQVEELVKRGWSNTLGVIYRRGSCWATDPDPVPINKDILLAAEFTYDDVVGMYWKEAWSIGHPSQRFDMYWSEDLGFIMSSRYQGFSKDLKLRHIKYIHNIQNLFYSLTDEHLIFKLC